MAIARSPSQIRTCGTVASGSCLRRQRQAASRDRDELCVQRPMRRRIRSQVMRAVWLRRRSVRYQSRPTWEAERGQCRAVHGHPVVPQMPLDNRAQPPAQLRRFCGGTRRASPGAGRVLVTVPSLTPRRRGTAASDSLRQSLLPSREKQTLGLRGFDFRGYPYVKPLRSLTLRPGDSLTILPMAWSMGFGFPLHCHPSYGASGSCPGGTVSH